MTAAPDPVADTAVTIRPARDADLLRLTNIHNHYVTDTAITFDLEPFTVDQRREWFTRYAETGRRFFPENSRRYLNGLEGNWKSIRSGQWKLIEIPKAETNLYELYDTQKDPGETTNLYRPGDPQAKELAARLHAWLDSFEGGAKPAEQEPREIDPATAERLRALGYMNR